MIKRFPSVQSSLLVPILFCLGVLFYGWFMFWDNVVGSRSFVIGFSVIMMLLCALAAVVTLPNCWCYIELYETHLICKIPLHKNIILEYNNCEIGMEYHWQNGSKIWWIYLCSGSRMPQSRRHPSETINKERCRQGFVRIMYREDVYNEILKLLPKHQKTCLISARRSAGIDKQGNMFW